MEHTDYKAEFKSLYDNRDVDGMIRFVSELVKSPKFTDINRRLIKQGKLPATAVKIHEVAAALIEELEDEIEQNGDVIAQDNYFEIAERLKKRFNDDVADIYIKTKAPNEFLNNIRIQHDQSDTSKLSDELVGRYKDELIRIEDGRRAVVDILQQHSNFPIKNVTALSELIEQLHLKLKSNNRYLSIKPYFLSIFKSADAQCSEPTPDGSEDTEISNCVLFPDYVTTGREPTLSQQILFRIEVVKLCQHLWKRNILPVAEHKQTVARINSYFSYRGDPELSRKAYRFLQELVNEINNDQTTILKRLAQTFVDEYYLAEQQMGIHYGMIDTELANTKEFLKQLAENICESDPSKEEKIQVAMEKVACLEGVFRISPLREQTASDTPFLELERTALGVSTIISSSQITEWIRIYSILFSNSEFLSHAEHKIDFSIMRKYISHLTTYHLIQGVSELKLVVNRALATPSEDKPDHFKKFGEVLKLKLQGLIRSKKEEEKSFQQMIQELNFIDNDATQYVIAETFKGFQEIADAFNNTVNDYFVRDREKLLKESRELYDQICAQCLKNVIVRPKKPATAPTPPSTEGNNTGKSWLGRLFSKA